MCHINMQRPIKIHTIHLCVCVYVGHYFPKITTGYLRILYKYVFMYIYTVCFCNCYRNKRKSAPGNRNRKLSIIFRYSDYKKRNKRTFFAIVFNWPLFSIVKSLIWSHTYFYSWYWEVLFTPVRVLMVLSE